MWRVAALALCLVGAYGAQSAERTYDLPKAAESVCEGISVEWSKPVEIGRGVYGRVRRLKDGRFMAAYSLHGDLIVAFSEKGRWDVWGEPKVAARHFVCGKEDDRIRVMLDNAEFAQLDDGEIVLATNLRPEGWRHDVHPCAIGIVASKDGGHTWSPLKIIHAPKADVPVDGKPHGCYEPFILSLGGRRMQIFFADETPYSKAGCKWQNISYVESRDGGLSWSAPAIAAYTHRRRDGMPVVADIGPWRYLAIEANPGKTCLHPQIVMISRDGDWRNAVRFEPLANPPDWRKYCGGAPYIAGTDNYILLSWQEDRFPQKGPMEVRIAAVPKSAVGADGRFSGMRTFTIPPHISSVKKSLLWNSVCHAGGDSFLLVSSEGGKIIAYPGKVVKVK